MPIPFLKIEGLGNDYIYVDSGSLRRSKSNLPALARAISDRRRGVGSDGLIVIVKSGPGVASMLIYNRDGSEAKFCGNGLRGVALFLKAVYGARGRKFVVDTRWNEYSIELVKSVKGVATVKASLGSPSFDCRRVGLVGEYVNCLGIRIPVAGGERILNCVALPNPHAIIFVDNFDFDWQKEGMEIEKNPIFRDGVNVMFTRVDSPRRITVTPWERGSGATAACGSGAAAATVISHLLKRTESQVTIRLPGGTLVTRYDIAANQIFQTGPTRIAFSGFYTP
jgi:diaminopimelate epimerase